MTIWERVAELLEAGPAHPDANLDAQILPLVRAKPWAEVGAILADTHRELNHRSTEAEEVTWAAGLVHVLRPMGWEQAPEGPELEQAIMRRFRATPDQA